jgi:hypothetical protein
MPYCALKYAAVVNMHFVLEDMDSSVMDKTQTLISITF